jgi:hypothetical protein
MNGFENADPGIVESVYNILQNKNITLNNIMYIVKELMTMVEDFKGLTGNEKRKIVLDTLDMVIYNHGGFYKNTLTTIARHVAPDVIDLIITASKNKLLLNVKNTIDDSANCFCF